MAVDEVVSAEVKLEKTRTSRVHRRRLRQGWILFVHYVSSFNLNLFTLVHDFDDVNQVLAEFVQWAFDKKYKLWIVRVALLAVQTKFKFLRHHIPRPWEAIRSWQLKLPSQNRVPITIQMVRAIFVVSIKLASKSDKWSLLFIQFALAVRLGFYAMLRPGELIRLRLCDLRLPHMDTSELVMVVALASPKNKAHMGRNQYATVSDSATVQYFRWFLTGLQSEVLLWPYGRARFAAMLCYILGILGLSDVGITPASFRPGGCTYYHMCGVSIADLKYRGRWAHEGSMAVYMQEAMATLVWSDLPDSLAASINDVVQAGNFVWSQPPKVCLHSFLP